MDNGYPHENVSWPISTDICSGHPPPLLRELSKREGNDGSQLITQAFWFRNYKHVNAAEVGDSWFLPKPNGGEKKKEKKICEDWPRDSDGS